MLTLDTNFYTDFPLGVIFISVDNTNRILRLFLPIKIKSYEIENLMNCDSVLIDFTSPKYFNLIFKNRDSRGFNTIFDEYPTENNYTLFCYHFLDKQVKLLRKFEIIDIKYPEHKFFDENFFPSDNDYANVTTIELSDLSIRFGHRIQRSNLF